jgi:glutathione S-transferase
MRLYYSPGSCALSPHIVALELGFRPDLVKVDLQSKRLPDGGDYLKVNGKGSVPALELDDGQVITEGPAIVQYLADLQPDLGLAPPNGTLERVRLQEWLNFISTDIHKSFSPLFNKQLPEEARKYFVSRLERSLGYAGEKLEGRTFLLGTAFTAADAYLFTVLRWAKGNGIDLGRWPALKDHFERVGARLTVKAAMEAQGIRT